MGSLTQRELVDAALNGNFYHVYKNITTNKTQRVEVGDAVKFIIAICNACHANMKTVDKLNAEEMMTLLKEILKFIHRPKEEQFNRYAHSVIFILAFLVKKGSFDCILQLEQLFLPDFIPVVLAENIQKVYFNICKSIYNVVVDFAQKKDPKHGALALKFSRLLSKIYKKMDNLTNLFADAYKCLSGLVQLEVPPEDISNYHSFTLKLLDRPDDSFYPLIINNLSFVFTHLLKEQRTDLASECFIATSNHLSTLYKSRDYEYLREILLAANWINPENVDKEAPLGAHSILKQYHRTYGSTTNLQSVCEFVSSSAFSSLHILKKSDLWGQKLQLHEQFYKFLNDVALIIAKSPQKCLSKCSCSTNVIDAARTLDTIVGLGKLTIAKNEVSRTYKMDIFRILEKLVDFVRTLKANDCHPWTKFWYNCGGHLYTIGSYCTKDAEMLLLYLQKFSRSHIEFEGCSPTVLGKRYLNLALNFIGDTYLEARDYEKSLIWTGFATIFSDNLKIEFYRWMRIKATSREDSLEENLELQKLTIVDVLEKKHVELVQEGFPLSLKNKIELLVSELRYYQAKWKSKLAMSVVFARLSQLVEPQRAAEVFVEIWGDGDLQVHQTLPGLLRDTIKKVERDSYPNKKLLAHLYFLQHKYRVKETIVKNCDEMERTMSVMDATEPPKDPDGECDLVSSYESLRLSHYTKMMKHLETSLKMIRHHVEPNERVFKLLVNIGNEFALHGNSSKAVEAFQLALGAAETKLQRLNAAGYIMEVSSPMDEPEFEDLVQDHREDVISFLLSKSQAYFFVDFQTSYAAFVRAFELSQPQVSPVLQARLDHIHHKFIMLPCDYNVIGHEEFSIVKIHLAIDKIRLYYLEAANITSYDLRMYFDIYETVSRMYFDLRLPRDVRCYAREGAVLAQKLVLPLRNLTFLTYLAHADITTLKFDDCIVKMKDHSDILGITSGYGLCQTPEKHDGLDEIIGHFEEIMLDAASIRAKTLGSPTFVSEGFKAVPFMSHEVECLCFYCTCSEYQDFVLKNAYLHAMLYEYLENHSLAKNFFSGCQKIYVFLRDRRDSFTRKIPSILIGSHRDKVLESYCYFLLEYANSLFRKDRFSDAKKMSKRALSKLESTTIRSHYLKNEILSQQLNFLLDEKERSKENPPLSPVLPSRPEYANAKTPVAQSKSGVFSIPKIKLNQITIIQPKVLNYESSDEEEKEEKEWPTNLPTFMIPAKTPVPKKKATVLKDIKPNGMCTPAKNYLQEKTELLTEKLKSTEKNRDDLRKRRDLERNLREIGQEGGAIRRSARNKK